MAQPVKDGERLRCPHDGGYCHHGCEKREGCFRERGGMYLSAPYPGFPKAGARDFYGEGCTDNGEHAVVRGED